MTDGDGPIDVDALAEQVRQACVEAAVGAYDDAATSGLCHEGAWEAAVGAIRSLDVTARIDALHRRAPRPSDVGAGGVLRAATARLAMELASPGPPAAGSAAAATGAIAAGLIEWTAARSERRGPDDFRERARAIRRRSAALRSSLASAGEEDAARVRAFFRADAHALPAETRRRATDSLLEIGTRCAQGATLAAEVAAHGHRAVRPDAVAALRLAEAAAEGALGLAEENLRADAGEEWSRGARKRIWRARLLLGRATSRLRDERAAVADPGDPA